MRKTGKIVNKLIKNKETISMMESCTGGCLASAVTNVEGASKVFKFGAVTYSNEYKIKMGVDKNVIDKYSVYSIETAREMSKNISEFTDSTYGIGITGKINREDENNKGGSDNKVFVSIFNNKTKEYIDIVIICPFKRRSKVKEYIVDKVLYSLEKELK